MDFKFTTKTAVLAVAGSLMALSAGAQWQWVDKDGRKVFSDRAPPADVLKKSILKEPANTALTPLTGKVEGPLAIAADTAASMPAVKASMPKLSGRDPELEARKKQADALEEAKKQTAAEKLANARAENCERVKKGQASLKLGVRIVITNANGEREFMDDAARAAETKRLEAIASTDCAR